MGGLWAMDLRRVQELHYLLTALNLPFSTLASLLIALEPDLSRHRKSWERMESDE
jgi:hypothetical protein